MAEQGGGAVARCFGAGWGGLCTGTLSCAGQDFLRTMLPSEALLIKLPFLLLD